MRQTIQLLLLVAFLLMACQVSAEVVDDTEDDVFHIDLFVVEETPESGETQAPSETLAISPVASPAPVQTPALPTATYRPSDNPQSEVGEDELLLSFVGDCSIGDTIKVIKRKNTMTGMIAENGPEWLFSTVSDIFHADDFTFANLESVLTDRMAPLYPAKVYNFLGPSSHREVIAASGIDGINTVNNHCTDFKYDGYKDTLANLEAIDVVHFGTLNPFRDTNSFKDLGRIEIKGVKIGITGYSYPDDKVFPCIEEDIRLLREEGCQIVIVSLHWGTEKKTVPDKKQFPYAKKVLDAGADVLWVHHPHVIQPVYFYDGKPIFFSTGNFVFSQIQAMDDSSGIFQLKWDIHTDGTVTLKQFEMIPTMVRHNREYRPLLLEDTKDKQ